METKKRKIGEILLENNLISKEALNEAVEYQNTFGGGITQYLLANGYITENDLALCLVDQFGFLYLPLGFYNIPDKIIKLVPAEIAEKYWLIPVDKIGNVVTVVMADPLDSEAIEKVEEILGSKVQQFVGLVSDIIEAIEYYYNITFEDMRLKSPKIAPLFIATKAYKGLERRKSVRLRAKIEVHFPFQDQYKKAITKDVSLHGFLFESENALPLGSYLALEINLPEEYSKFPIAAVVQVVRVTLLENNNFDIGAKIVKILREDAETVIKYAGTHKE